METISLELKEKGVRDENIIYLNLDKRGFRKIKTADQLDALIEERSAEEEEYSIFITGSNSYLLSGELATKLTGRYLEFEVFTLSFSEYLGMKTFLKKTVSPDLTAEFDLYLTEGGFPKALSYEGADKQAYIRELGKSLRRIFERE